jgi:lipopolysaccharide/colanic/teichoic acid biosynthesis glycosyltransferase
MFLIARGHESRAYERPEPWWLVLLSKVGFYPIGQRWNVALSLKLDHMRESRRFLVNDPRRVAEILDQRHVDDSPVPRWKRVFDITCILCSLPLLIPLMVTIGLAIKALSPGPVLVLQERVGYRGRRFICFRFRTMKAGAARSSSPIKQMHADQPRLIPLGTLLRATGLDELPQLLNVLGGQMSLVGPRPCLPYEYETQTASEKRRFDTLPGLTGLWQAKGKNEATTKKMVAALDIAYVETKSLGQDVKILLKTLPAMSAKFREALPSKSRWDCS